MTKNKKELYRKVLNLKALTNKAFKEAEAENALCYHPQKCQIVCGCQQEDCPILYCCQNDLADNLFAKAEDLFADYQIAKEKYQASFEKGGAKK